MANKEIESQAQTQCCDDDIEICFLVRCEVSLGLIDLKCGKDQSDEDGGDEAPNKCLTNEYESVFLESEESSVIDIRRFNIMIAIGVVRGDAMNGILV